MGRLDCKVASLGALSSLAQTSNYFMTMICVDKCLNIFEYDEFITPKYNMTNNHKRSVAFKRLKDAPKHLYKTKMCTRKNCDKKNSFS